MQGDIQVSSTVGQGCTFSFTAQFGHDQSIKKHHRSYADAFKGMKALVVDENSSSCTVMSSYLESFEFDVSQASSGEDAILLLEKTPRDQPYRLVLIDRKLPKMDGIAVVRHIRNNPEIIWPPRIIMVTVYGREDLMGQLGNADLDSLLAKPVQSSVLHNAITDIFGFNDLDDMGYSSPIEDARQAGNSLLPLKGVKILFV